jgi:ABC-type nitrate/sulfonate/bicarbonate transport system substrate-binding protein
VLTVLIRGDLEMNVKQKLKQNSYIIIFICIVVVLLVRYKCREESIQNNYVSNEKISNYKVKIAFFGDISEAPLFVGVLKRFFIKEGIKVELVKTDIKDIKEKINSSQIDGVTADYRTFKKIQEGMKLKLVAGLNSGCMELVTLKKSGITNISDLKHKTIGVESKGSGSMVVASKLLRSNDIDPARDIKWKYYKGEDMYEELKHHKVDALCKWEDYDKAKETHNTEYKVIFRSSAESRGGNCHSSYKHFYEGFAALSDNLIEKHPKLSAVVTKAWMKSADWISGNRKQTIDMLLKQGYISGDFKSINDISNTFMWMPEAHYVSQDITLYLDEQKAQGIIKSKEDTDKLLDNSFSQIIP